MPAGVGGGEGAAAPETGQRGLGRCDARGDSLGLGGRARWRLGAGCSKGVAAGPYFLQLGSFSETILRLDP